MDKLISIIVPIYNCEKYLEKCLNSIINQTYKKLEIILINDGSIDDSEKICQQFLSKDGRVKYIKQKNMGVSTARNNGIKQATGDFVCFVDSDDYLEQDYINELKKGMIRSELTISEYYINSNDEETHKSYDINNVIKKEEFLKKIVYDDFFCGYLWNKMYNLSIIKENNIAFNPQIKIMEDFLFNIEYVEYVENIQIIKKPLYHYIENPNGAMNSIKRNKDITVLSVLPLIIEKYEKYKLHEECKIYKMKYILESYRAKYEFKKDVNCDKINQYLNEIPCVLKIKIPFKLKLKFMIITKFPKLYYALKNIVKR